MCSCQLCKGSLVFLTEAITSDSYIYTFNISNITKENILIFLPSKLGTRQRNWTRAFRFYEVEFTISPTTHYCCDQV